MGDFHHNVPVAITQEQVFQPTDFTSPSVMRANGEVGSHGRIYAGVRNKPAGPTGWKACNCLIACTQGLPVLIAVAIILFGFVGFNFYIGVDVVQSRMLKGIYYVTCNFLCVMVLWCYAKAILTKPGSVPDEYAVAKQFQLCDESGQLYGIRPFVPIPRPMYEKCNTGAPRYCYKCNVLKPDRAHHCSICKECVLKMDHHCPWVANCVGFHNQKFFVLFLAWAFAYCMFFLVTLLPYMIAVAKAIAEECKEQQHEGPCSPFASGDVEGVAYPTLVVIMFVLAGIFSLAVGGLGAIHIYYVLENTNTIESVRMPKVWPRCRTVNPYDLGRRQNWAYVMGPVWWLWIVPIANGEGDGIVYPICALEDEEAQAADSDAVALLATHSSQ